MIIVADTSALLAAFDLQEQRSSAALEILNNETLHISPLVMAELDHLLRRDYDFDNAMNVCSRLIKDFLGGVHHLAQITAEDFATADRVREMYRGLQLDLADTVGVALAAKYQTNRIFTLDQRDFRAIKPLTPAFDHFEILPIDL